MTKIIGVSSAHDSSLCVYDKGNIEFFVKEERLSRIKRDKMPILALNYFDYHAEELDLAYSSPVQDIDSFNNYLGIARKRHNLKNIYDYSDQHHLVHANLAFFNSGFAEALVVVIDRNGSAFANSCREAETVYLASYPNNFKSLYKSFWIYDAYAHEAKKEIQEMFPETDLNIRSMFGITKVYETATSLILQDSLENGKTMGLAAYGDKSIKQQDMFVNKIIPNDYYFSHESLFGTNRNATNADIQKFANKNITKDNYTFYANYAWQIQKQTQEAVASLVDKYVKQSGIKNVCITGGYGLNVVANHYLITNFPDINFYFEPIADDSGNSLGSAMKAYRDSTLDDKIYKLEHTFFNGKNYNLDIIDGNDITVDDVAKLISSGKSVAVYQGLAEAGPRALGNRSILFDPRDLDAKDKVNKIKNREWYRPFAGMVLEEDANIFFDMGRLTKSEFMTISFPVKDFAETVIPGVVHFDKTCRVQTVSKNNIIPYKLLQSFKNITGIGVILNTSFNLAGQPLVETPQEALGTLYNSPLDYVWFPEIGKIVGKS